MKDFEKEGRSVDIMGNIKKLLSGAVSLALSQGKISLMVFGVVSVALGIAPRVCEASSCGSHWRDVAYDTKIMRPYKPYAHCVQWTASQFELPEELLYSIIYVERGDINGRCMVNKNGTEDCGPAQINDVRLGEIRRFDLDKGDMRTNPCRNIWAMGYLMRREIEKADGDIWKGVGNYHYHYSVNQAIHDRYVTLIRGAWNKLYELVGSQCGE